MEPISALGVAAGTLQFIDSAVKVLLGTIRILKEANDMPGWMKILLHDVEKSVKHIRSLRDLFDGLEAHLDKLGANHLHHVKDNMTDICEATIDFKNILQPLVIPRQTQTDLCRYQIRDRKISNRTKSFEAFTSEPDPFSIVAGSSSGITGDFGVRVSYRLCIIFSLGSQKTSRTNHPTNSIPA